MTLPSPPSAPVLPDADDDPVGTVKLPAVVCNPLASLGPAEIEVEALGRVWTVPAMTAAQWLEVLWGEPFDPEDIFPGLVGAYEELYDAMFDGVIDRDEAFDIAMEILEEASGYRWWYTLRATAFVRASWARIGGLVPLDPANVSLGLYITAYIAHTVEHIPPKNAVALITELIEVPKGFGGEETEEEEDNAAFFAAMGSL